MAQDIVQWRILYRRSLKPLSFNSREITSENMKHNTQNVVDSDVINRDKCHFKASA
jgi:hypothetical protein